MMPHRSQLLLRRLPLFPNSEPQKGKAWQPAHELYACLTLLHKGCYEYLLRCGEAGTYAAPQGQLRGRAGRKCLLEDAERYLRRAIELEASRPEAYAVLALNLVEMGRGREKEVPDIIKIMLDLPLVANAPTTGSIQQYVELGRQALRKAAPSLRNLGKDFRDHAVNAIDQVV